jgi:hypothetical protein
MSAVNTDARIPAGSEQGLNLINTGGTGSNNQVWRVKINGKSTFVQTRLNADGSTAYIANERTGNPDIVGTVVRPYVLAVVDPQGGVTFGGSGKTSNTGILGIRSAGNIEVTTPETAAAILATGTINGSASTQEQQLSLGYQKAVNLSVQRISNNFLSPGFNQDAFIPKEAITGGAQPLQVIPFNVEKESEVASDEVEPGNNDPAASTGAESIGAQFAAAGDTLQDLGKVVLDKLGEANDFLKISDADIAKFNKLFEEGGGDPIKNAKYPFDANYGDIRGQDYVTIDQFIYQPPRKNQIFGTGGINPLENLTQGQQRISSLKKFIAQVKLPMPNNITDSNNISWGDDAMNNLSATLTSAVMSNPVAGMAGGAVSAFGGGPLGQLIPLMAAGLGSQNPGITNPDGSQDASVNGKFIAMSKMLQSSGGEAAMKTQFGSSILGALGVNVSPESLLSRGFGVIPNSNNELLFNKVTLRDFQFSWRMSPRDEQEALEVKRIIRFFKQGMAAKTMANQAGERSLYLGAPNIFRLQYRTAGGRIIEGVNRIKPCAVVGTAVNYTPDGQWSAYDEGQPVSCTIAIQMKELEPVYATDYTMDILGDRRSNDVTDIPARDGDLYQIRPTEVGY